MKSASKIGVISDTHYSKTHQTAIPIEKITRAFKGADLIIHAGDIVNIALLDALRVIAPVEAVCGNMDDVETCSALPRTKVLDVSGVRIGVVHGAGGGAPEDFLRYFEGEKLDIVVFGHTHVPYSRVLKSVLFFNPGSPVKPAMGLGPSVGLLRLSPGPKPAISCEIIQLS